MVEGHTMEAYTAKGHMVEGCMLEGHMVQRHRRESLTLEENMMAGHSVVEYGGKGFGGEILSLSKTNLIFLKWRF
jgi:hypothetical protein